MTTSLSNIEKLFGAFDSASTHKGIFACLQSHLRSLGFEFFTYDLLRAPRNQTSLHYTTFSSEFTKQYIAKRYTRFDIMVRQASLTLRPFTWTDASRGKQLSGDQLRVRHEAAECGMRSCGIVPIHGPGTAKAYLVVSNRMKASEFDKLFAASRHELQLVGAYMHEKVLALNTDKYVRTAVPLTDREMEILTWAALGKSNRDIGGILSLAPSTVKQHFENIFEKLEVTSRAHAVGVAISAGFVSL